jgi:hypothetical protein
VVVTGGVWSLSQRIEIESSEEQQRKKGEDLLLLLIDVVLVPAAWRASESTQETHNTLTTVINYPERSPCPPSTSPVLITRTSGSSSSESSSPSRDVESTLK